MGAVGEYVLRPAPASAPAASWQWRDYVTLTKPRIMSLLVLTAACAMIGASGGDPSVRCGCWR